MRIFELFPKDKVVVVLICIGLFFLSGCLIALSRRTRKPRNYKYQQRGFLLTKNEAAFYRQLLPIASQKGLTVFAKVRIADLIEPRSRARHWRGAFSRISSKHVDFVLCSSTTLLPLLALELDDPSHDRRDRSERDRFVDKAFASAGLPIVHTRSVSGLSKDIDRALSGKSKKAEARR